MGDNFAAAASPLSRLLLLVEVVVVSLLPLPPNKNKLDQSKQSTDNSGEGTVNHKSAFNVCASACWKKGDDDWDYYACC